MKSRMTLAGLIPAKTGELVQSHGMTTNALAAKAGKVATALKKNSVSGYPVLRGVFANP